MASELAGRSGHTSGQVVLGTLSFTQGPAHQTWGEEQLKWKHALVWLSDFGTPRHLRPTRPCSVRPLHSSPSQESSEPHPVVQPLFYRQCSHPLFLSPETTGSCRPEETSAGWLRAGRCEEGRGGRKGCKGRTAEAQGLGGQEWSRHWVRVSGGPGEGSFLGVAPRHPVWCLLRCRLPASGA